MELIGSFAALITMLGVISIVVFFIQESTQYSDNTNSAAQEDEDLKNLTENSMFLRRKAEILTAQGKQADEIKDIIYAEGENGSLDNALTEAMWAPLRRTGAYIKQTAPKRSLRSYSEQERKELERLSENSMYLRQKVNSFMFEGRPAEEIFYLIENEGRTLNLDGPFSGMISDMISIPPDIAEEREESETGNTQDNSDEYKALQTIANSSMFLRQKADEYLDRGKPFDEVEQLILAQKEELDFNDTTGDALVELLDSAGALQGQQNELPAYGDNAEPPNIENFSDIKYKKEQIAQQLVKEKSLEELEAFLQQPASNTTESSYWEKEEAFFKGQNTPAAPAVLEENNIAEEKNGTEELIDVNTCDEQALLSLNILSLQQVKKILLNRQFQGGYKSFEDFVRANNLEPHIVVQLRGLIKTKTLTPKEATGILDI